MDGCVYLLPNIINHNIQRVGTFDIIFKFYVIGTDEKTYKQNDIMVIYRRNTNLQFKEFKIAQSTKKFNCYKIT